MWISKDFGANPALRNERDLNWYADLIDDKFFTVMTSQGPAFQECTGSCHENVSTQRSYPPICDGLTVLARIEMVAIDINHPTILHTQFLAISFIHKCGKEDNVNPCI